MENGYKSNDAQLFVSGKLCMCTFDHSERESIGRLFAVIPVLKDYKTCSLQVVLCSQDFDPSLT